MTKKFFLHLFLFLVVLFSLWYAISQISIREVIQTEKRLEQLEEKLNRWTIRFFKNEYTQIRDHKIDSLIGLITEDLFTKNQFLNKDIEILVFESDDVNAFALPGKTIIVFSGLIEFTHTEEEFLGILAHEIGHIEENHVIKKLSKEIGLAALFSLLSGSYNIDVISEIAKTISSTAYDRGLEKEADMLAVEYLQNANINPRGYVDLLIRFSEEIDTIHPDLRWISTHPDSYERAQSLLDVIEKKHQSVYRISNELNWKQFKNRIQNE